MIWTQEIQDNVPNIFHSNPNTFCPKCDGK